MKKLEEQKTITYDIGEGFRIDIVTIKNEFLQVWIYHKDYGIKDYMFGLPEDKNIKEIIENNIETYKEYYKQDYMEVDYEKNNNDMY